MAKNKDIQYIFSTKLITCYLHKLCLIIIAAFSVILDILQPHQLLLQEFMTIC